MDSGNLYTNVISLKFLHRLGFTEADLIPADDTSIKTAKVGADLTVLGRTKNKLHLRFGDVGTKFAFRPVVLQELTMPMNISAPFLRKHGIDQLHSAGAIRVSGQLVPLVHGSASTSNLTESVCGAVFVAEDVTVPPLSSKFLPLEIPEVAFNQMPSGDGLIEGGMGFRKSVISNRN